jgi:hypothetical protein
MVGASRFSFYFSTTIPDKSFRNKLLKAPAFRGAERSENRSEVGLEVPTKLCNKTF